MGRGGKAGKRESGETTGVRRGALRAPFVASELREVPIPGHVPRFEIPDWREKYGVVAGITGRGFDLGLWSSEPVGEVMNRWLTFRREMQDFHATVLGRQVHGVEVMSLDAGRGWIQVDSIDGWTTVTPGVLLTVTVADCIPVYLVVPEKGVALLHAGWRGTAGGILARGVHQLCDRTGSSQADVLMHCGAGICGTCYEVGYEVMQGCGAPAEGQGPWLLDLREQLTRQARKLGLTRSTASAWCSAHDRSSFYSHRASRGSDGRMVAYIGMQAGPLGSGVAGSV